MLTAQAVFEKLTLITDTDQSEQAELLPFCESAAAVINSKMRTDADASDIRLLMAAAALAYSRYLLINNAADSNITSFKAGDLSVTKAAGDSSDSVHSFALAALEDAKDLLEDTSFFFRSL